MTQNNNGRIRKQTVRRDKTGNHATHVWVNPNKGVSSVSKRRRSGMRAGLEQSATPSSYSEAPDISATPLATSSGSGNVRPPEGRSFSTSYGNSGPSRDAVKMFGDAAGALAARPVPAVSSGAQKWSLTKEPASVQRAMGALPDLRNVTTPLPAGSLSRVFAGVS